MNQDSLQKFLDKVNKISVLLGLTDDKTVKTNLITAVFVDFRNKFIDKNNNQEVVDKLSGIDDLVVFGNKLNEMGLNSKEDFEKSCSEVLSDYILELEQKLEPEMITKLRKIVN